MTDTSPARQTLADLFAARSIRRVAIIDDAYSPFPTTADLRTAGLEALWANIEADDEALRELEGLGVKLESPVDLNDSILERLFKERANMPHLEHILSEYDGIQAGKLTQLRELEALLESLRCGVSRLTPSQELPTEALPELIFLDYLLDPRGADYSLPLAREIGAKIKNAYAANQKPFVLLTSSLDDIKPEMRSLFRETAGLIGGMFHFVPKSDFAKEQRILLKLALMIRSVDDGRKIQAFVEAFETQMLNAVGVFNKKVRALSVEDYAFIQKLSLHGEGQPLGDYLLWIFGTYFAQLLFASMPEHRKILDQLAFDHIPDAADPPSPDFVELYQNVVSEPIEQLDIHPRVPDVERVKFGEAAPTDPHFGDLFLRDDGQALLVITAECDLMYAPEPEAKRPFDPRQSVFLVPGRLEEQTQPVADDTTVTSFLQCDGKNLRVLWNLNSVRSEPLGSLSKLRETGFIRRRRLRLPFALDIQKAFTNQLERIGIPISPPIPRAAHVEICCHGKDGETCSILSVTSGAATIMMTRSNVEQVQLRLESIVSISDVLPKAIELLQARIAAAKAASKNTQRLEIDLEKLQKFAADPVAQLTLHAPFELKETGQWNFPSAPVQVVRQIKDNDRAHWSTARPGILLIIHEIVPIVAQEQA